MSAEQPSDPVAIECSGHVPTSDAERFDPAWRTSTVLALAQGIIQESAFDRMPILADALQDAGCDNEVILDHCRHARGHESACWVLALILSPTPTQPSSPAPTPRRESRRNVLRVASRWIENGFDFAMVRVMLPLALVGAVACGIGMLYALSRVGTSSSPPAPITIPAPDPWTTTFGPKPEVKLALLRNKLKQLLAAPDSDPQEIARTRELIRMWAEFVGEKTAPKKEGPARDGDAATPPVKTKQPP
jgi:hypothetical protein